MQYSSHVKPDTTPQSEPLIGKDMVKNNAGGFVFKTSSWMQLNRFLLMGSEGGTYYVKERPLTQENAKNTIACIKENGEKALNEIVRVSTNGLAAKNGPAIFALALVCTHGDAYVKRLAYDKIGDVCRIGTDLFTFCQSIQDLRGWSRGLRKAVAKWYLAKNSDKLAYQLIKYRQRNGWTHRDVMRLSHPKTKDKNLNSLLAFAVGKPKHCIHPKVEAFEALQKETDIGAASLLIIDQDLPREAVPTELLKSPFIWDVLLQKMPLHAMTRNLGVMTANGLITSNFDEATNLVCSKLNQEAILKSKIHPIQILLALKTYAKGRGVKGKLSWTPVQKVVDALDQAFYMAFDNVESTKKNYLLSLDVSGSMDSEILGMPLSAREASSAMAMVTAKTEPNHQITAFSNTYVNLGISPFARLKDIVEATARLPFSGTDCALPMIYATKLKLPIDVFIVYTDNETWAGQKHPCIALNEFRQASGRAAKLIVVATSSTGFTIADPEDPGMLDVAGFDASLPQVIRNFVMG